MARSVRPVGRRIALIASAIAVLLFTHASTFAQSAASYDALVDQYAHGDAVAALAAMARWPASAVTNAANNRPRFMSTDRQRAAIMLHTDLAFAYLQARATSDVSTHLAVARHILTIVKNGARDDARAQTFERRWYAYVTSMYTAQGMLTQADLIVRDGMGLYPRDARLHVARGSIREMDATLTAADPRSGGQVYRTSRWFESAAADYRRAIELDDTLASAYLHLGWVRLRARDDRSLIDFEAALAHADDDSTRYLANLFLGAFAERHDHLEDARRHYEAAMAVGSAYQTAYVALSRIEEASGHSARAQELARAYAALGARVEDPWWNYHLGSFDQPTLDWLRREARSQ